MRTIDNIIVDVNVIELKIRSEFNPMDVLLLVLLVVSSRATPMDENNNRGQPKHNCVAVRLGVNLFRS